MTSRDAAYQFRCGHALWVEAQVDPLAVAGDLFCVWVADGAAFARQIDDQSALGGDRLAQSAERAVGEDAARADDHHPGAQGLDVVHVVRGEDNGGAAFLVEALYKVAHRQLRHRVEADGGFVEEEQTRPVQEGGGDIAAHALAQRQLAHRHVEQWLEIE